MLKGELKVVPGLGNKLRAAMTNVASEETMAKMHRGMAEPGTANDKEPASKKGRTDRPRP